MIAFIGIAPSSIVVQSPYIAQVQLLRERLEEDLPAATGVQIASVDSFQGREADAVIISMVLNPYLLPQFSYNGLALIYIYIYIYIQDTSAIAHKIGIVELDRFIKVHKFAFNPSYNY